MVCAEERLVVDLVSDVHADHQRVAAVARRNIAQAGDPVTRRVAGQVPQALFVCCVGAHPARLGDMIVHDDHESIGSQAVHDAVKQFHRSDVIQTRAFRGADSDDVLTLDTRIVSNHFYGKWETDAVGSHANNLSRNIGDGLTLEPPDTEKLLVRSIPIDTLEVDLLSCFRIDDEGTVGAQRAKYTVQVQAPEK